MKQWKSLEAYNNFQSGHVHDIRLDEVPATRSCVVMAFVNPSQSAQRMHTIHGLVLSVMAQLLQGTVHVWLGKVLVPVDLVDVLS